ncbi:hypothetical protein KUCAC02_019234 [Chaenocephalus aceratus]|nr:hypothetical protein KUCAC02_019234 [Chaenocephalus aceratus]
MGNIYFSINIPYTGTITIKCKYSGSSATSGDVQSGALMLYSSLSQTL